MPSWTESPDVQGCVQPSGAPDAEARRRPLVAPQHLKALAGLLHHDLQRDELSLRLFAPEARRPFQQ